MPASWMRAETLEAAGRVAALLERDAERYAALGAAWRERPPSALLTLARGSSDHAAAHFAYLAMARAGVPVTSLPLSLITLYGAALARATTPALVFSQSGRSPDLVEPTRGLRAAGAPTVAVVNDEASPLATAAETVLPLHAGPERSVAATKSFIAQLVAGARLLAAWRGDAALARALPGLPDVLQAAASLDTAPAVAALAGARQLYVIGRGPGLALAQETALKFKEVCGVHAEAHSSAEVMHGPLALVGDGFPVLVLALRGPAQPGLRAAAQALRERGAAVLVAGADGGLPLVGAGAEDLDTIAAAPTLYRLVESLALARGLDPDRPRHLSKVTLTR